MPEGTFRKKIVIDSDELKIVAKEMKKIAADLRQAAKGESQLRLEKLEGQKRALQRRAGEARKRSIKGFGQQQRVAAIGAAASVVLADKALDLLLKFSRTRDFSKVLQEELKQFLDSVPVIGRIRQLIEQENKRERSKLIAEVTEATRLADVQRQFQASPRKRAEGRRLLSKQYEDEQARLLRSNQGRRF